MNTLYVLDLNDPALECKLEGREFHKLIISECDKRKLGEKLGLILSRVRPLKEPTNVAKEVIDFFNKSVGTSYKHTTKSTVQKINARVREGFTLTDFCMVISFKKEQWYTDEKMAPYLRPETLFGTKFESYLQEAKRFLNSPSVAPVQKYTRKELVL
jgi:uncharacterized phage protein (TIGR02220 family)